MSVIWHQMFAGTTLLVQIPLAIILVRAIEALPVNRQIVLQTLARPQEMVQFVVTTLSATTQLKVNCRFVFVLVDMRATQILDVLIETNVAMQRFVQLHRSALMNLEAINV